MEAAGKRYILHSGKAGDVFSIWNVSDIHLGNRGCNLEKLKDDIERIKNDPFSFWVGGGDYADYISPKDQKRWSASSIDPSFTIADLGRLGKAQAERIRDLFDPIRHKCFGLLMGNHETKYMGAHEQEDLHSWLCTELELPNLGYCAFFDVIFTNYGRHKEPHLVMLNPYANGEGTRFSVRFFVHHGFGGATTPSGKLNSLIKAMTQFEADVYMMGHVHDQKAQRNVRLACDADCKRITQKESIGVITGAYLRTYTQGCSGYGEQKGYNATPLGAVRVSICPSKKEIRGDV